MFNVGLFIIMDPLFFIDNIFKIKIIALFINNITS